MNAVIHKRIVLSAPEYQPGGQGLNPSHGKKKRPTHPPAHQPSTLQRLTKIKN